MQTAASLKGRPPAKKPKSIVNQKQTPWGMIVTAIVLVVFAGGIVTFAVTRGGGSSSSSSAYTQPELADAKKIPGLTYKPEPNHTHLTGVIKYDTTPPTGGNHSATWADCNTVYPNAIANENAVHALEHGAVWITYNKDTLPADQVAILTKLVQSQQNVFMSPYPDLDVPISLQFWDYQLKITTPNANDARITEFISLLKKNLSYMPENASCANAAFISNPSTFGNPI